MEAGDGNRERSDDGWQLRLLLQLRNSKHSSRNSYCRARTVHARGEMSADVDGDGMLTNMCEIDGCLDDRWHLLQKHL